jgi:hypothetical protein
MRTSIVKFALVAMLFIGLVGVAMPARADGGAPFNPGDGRIDPMTGDRLAVYCNDNDVVVWGLDAESVGFYMTTFTMDELLSKTPVTHTTLQGKVTLNMDSPAVQHWGYNLPSDTTLSLITDTGTQYHITWIGSYGADGSTPFVKTFSCTYPG